MEESRRGERKGGEGIEREWKGGEWRRGERKEEEEIERERKGEGGERKRGTLIPAESPRVPKEESAKVPVAAVTRDPPRSPVEAQVNPPCRYASVGKGKGNEWEGEGDGEEEEGVGEEEGDGEGKRKGMEKEKEGKR